MDSIKANTRTIRALLNRVEDEARKPAPDAGMIAELCSNIRSTVNTVDEQVDAVTDTVRCLGRPWPNRVIPPG